MPFDFDLLQSVAPFGGHLGKIVLRVKHTGAYTRSGKLDLSDYVPSGVQLNQILMPHPMVFKRTGALLAIQPEFRRVGPVTACSVSGGEAKVTVNPHYLLTKDRVRVRKVLGSTEINGEWEIQRDSASVFAVPSVTSVTAFSTSADSIVEVERPLGTLTISAINLTTEVVTTSAAHGLAVGDLVTCTAIAGCTPSFDPIGKLLEVATVPSSTTVTFKNLTFSGSAFSGTTQLYPVRTIKKFGMLAIRDKRVMGVSAATIASPSVLTMQETHNLQVGDSILASSFLDSTVGTNLNGKRRVRTTPAGTTLTMEDESGAAVNCASGTHTANSGLLTVNYELASTQEFYDEGVWEFVIHGAKRLNHYPSLTRW